MSQTANSPAVPDVASAVRAGRAAGLPPASADTVRRLLLLVDMQVDFVHADGALSVPGAMEDAARVAGWLRAHSGEITAVAASLDSHVPLQIFSPGWWADADGQPPAPYTVISAQAVADGLWRPLLMPDWSREYVRRLEAQAKKALMIWPYHTLIGTPGHALAPVIYEAIAYHSAARQAQPLLLLKGSLPETEHYSILEPEVKLEGQPSGVLNSDFLRVLNAYDMVYIAGEAKSHCVLETVRSIVNACAGERRLLERFHVLQDAMSSVRHPEIDFDAQAHAAFAQFAAQGLRLTTTAEAL